VQVIMTENTGESSVLHPAEVEDPSVDPGEVIVQVAAAGVNKADLLQRAGRYPPPPGAPPWLGLEVSGTVVQVGPPGDDGPVRWRVGDQVCALLPGGGYAQRVAVDAGLVLPVPDGIDLVDAAALPEAAATMLSNLDAVGAAPGRSVLVGGGSGGVGSFGVQLAHAMGLRVLTTAGGPGRVARLADICAGQVFDHRADSLVDDVLAATGGRGVDIIVDVVGAAALTDNLAMLADDGHLVVIGLQQGSRAALDLGLLLARRLSVHGTTLRSRPLAQRRAIMAEVRRRVWPLVADGRVRPVVHVRLPWTDAERAHRLLRDGAAFGKVLLVVA
jgi:NADPH:quinone reductase